MKMDMDQCPRCRNHTWRMNISLAFTAPGSCYGAMTKARIRAGDVQIIAADYNSVSWYCSWCGYSVDAPTRPGER